MRTEAPAADEVTDVGRRNQGEEGAFQTIVKIVAGLVVGYLLIKFGLRQ